MSRNVRAGNAYVELGLKTKFGKGLQNAQNRLNSFGKSALAIGSSMSATGIAMMAPLLFAAATAQEVGSKFDTVFGNNAEAVREWGDEFANQVGRSRTQITEFLASNQDLFVPLGFDSDSAESLSKQVTGLAVDLASFNNKADADVMNDLQAALTGSGEVMKKYGVILSQAAVDQELVRKGMDPKAATEAQKAQARLNIIMAGTTAAQGDAVRTGGSFTNTMKALTANASDLSVVLGEHLIPPATYVFGLFNRAATAVLGFADSNSILVRNVLYVVGGLTAVGGLLLAVGGSAIAASALIPPLIGVLGFVASALSSLVVPGAIAAAVFATIGTVIYANRDAITSYAMAFWAILSPIRGAVGQIYSLVASVFGGISDAITAGDYVGAVSILWTGIQAVFFTGASMSLEAVAWLYEMAVGIFGSMVSAVKQQVAPLAGVFTPVADGIGSTFGGVFDWLTDGLGGLYQNFRATFGGIASAIMGGDIGLAADILWASIVLAFTAGTGTVMSLWSSFTLGLKEVWSMMSTGIVSVFRGTVAAIAGAMQSMTDKMRSLLESVAQYDPTGATAKIAESLGTVSEFVGIAEEDLRARQKTAEEKRNREQLARGKAHLEELQRISKRTEDAKAERDALVDRANAAGEGITLGTLKTASVDDLQKKLAKASTEAKIAMDEGKRAEVQETQEKTTQRGSELAGKTKTSSVGSFSAIGATLLGLGGGSVAEKTATNTEKTATNTGQMLGQLKRLRNAPDPPAFQG